MDTHRPEQTQCSRPPALDDLDLIAAADGEARADVLSHLAVCEYCAKRAHSFAALQALLRRRLFRAFCPSTDDLVAHQYGLLPRERAASLRAHLAECPHCAGEMEMIASASRDVPPAPAPRRVAKRRLIAELLSSWGPRELMPLYGAARSIAGAQYAYRADNLELTLHVAKAAGQPNRLVMSGTLAAEDDGLMQQFGEATATLIRGDDVLAEVPLDELGGFLFDDLLPGEYSLALRFNDTEVIVESLIV
ncbi:MAG: zf-HC2 domain-containing protein [Chloroflexota bacterium]